MTPEANHAPVSYYNDTGRARALLVCEHASNFIPAQFNNLQLSDKPLRSHIAIDIGAFDLAKAISRLLNAPLISTTVSRLVYDCNRALGRADAVPENSEVFSIPGNMNLSDTETRGRFEQYYLPFESALSRRLTEFPEPPLLLTIHSFTPVYRGEKRKVDIGIISDRDSRLGDQMVRLAPQQTTLHVASNQPYGPEDGCTHTLDFHGNRNALLNTMIEVKSDLLDSVDKCQQIALLLATLISRSAEHFGYAIPLETKSAANS